MVVVPVPP
jgi:hypothetical protein